MFRFHGENGYGDASCYITRTVPALFPTISAGYIYCSDKYLVRYTQDASINTHTSSNSVHFCRQIIAGTEESRQISSNDPDVEANGWSFAHCRYEVPKIVGFMKTILNMFKDLTVAMSRFFTEGKLF